jgi:hypothetical protein
VIGEHNPWIHKRGQGISHINHTWRQIGMPSSNITEYGGNESFANRTEKSVKAAKVVFTAGSGSARKPPEAEENSTVQNRARIRNLGQALIDLTPQPGQEVESGLAGLDMEDR